MDEIDLGIRQAKGAQAGELLNSEILKESFAALEAEYLKSWRSTRSQDTDGRERLWTAVRTLDLVKAHLAKLVTNGKIATKDLAEIKYLKR